MRFKPRRFSPRLPWFDYVGGYAYNVVLTTKNRIPHFRDGEFVAPCLTSLNASAARYGFEIAAYCFMPDHLHLLVTGSEDAPLLRFVQHFKQATTRHYPGLWQRSFYDHILRSEEALEDVALYIWANPLRARLVDDAAEYPYSGPREALMGEAGRLSIVEDRASARGGPAFGGEALSLQSGAPHAAGEKARS